MTCSCCAFDNTADQQFNAERVAKELLQYRRKGPGPTTRGMREGLVSTGLRQGTVLDIGGGLGILSLELLAAGLSRAVVVDAFVRLGVWLENAVRRWRGNPFRTFVHPPSDMMRMIECAGFTLASRRQTLSWSSDVFVKRSAGLTLEGPSGSTLDRARSAT